MSDRRNSGEWVRRREGTPIGRTTDRGSGLRLLARGLFNAEIGAGLFVGDATANTDVSNVLTTLVISACGTGLALCAVG